MIKTVKKLLFGYASMKNYNVIKCLRDRESLIVVYNGKKMTLTPRKLIEGRQLTKKRFKSRYTDSYYSLIDYKFIPDGEKNEPELFCSVSSGTRGKESPSVNSTDKGSVEDSEQAAWRFSLQAN